MIYFLRSGDLIKIGQAKSFDKRMYALRCDLPCPNDTELLAEMTGNRRGEQLLHNCFAGTHAFGEWFHHSEELDTWITAFGIPPDATRAAHVSVFMRRGHARGWRLEERLAAKRARMLELKELARAIASRKRKERELAGRIPTNRLTRFSA